MALLSLCANWIQSHESGLHGWTINSRGNERCLSSCGYCAPDQDRGINTVWANPRSHTNQRVQNIEILYNREKMQKMYWITATHSRQRSPGNREQKQTEGLKQRVKPLRPCQSINTVVQRSACNSGESEHHLYGWGSGGHWSNQVGGSWLSELVSSAERQAGTVMRIMTS